MLEKYGITSKRTVCLVCVTIAFVIMAGCQKSGSLEASSSVSEESGNSTLSPSAGSIEPEDSSSIRPASSDTIEYSNEQYGFTIILPGSWKNYTVVLQQWEGNEMNEGAPQELAKTGPMLLIRHPLWTSQNPRQDVPVMIFTPDQWDALAKEEWHIGAAPINPSELGRNSRYIFALPARYNYAYQTGYEEVDEIIKNGAFQANENIEG